MFTTRKHAMQSSLRRIYENDKEVTLKSWKLRRKNSLLLCVGHYHRWEHFWHQMCGDFLELAPLPQVRVMRNMPICGNSDAGLGDMKYGESKTFHACLARWGVTPGNYHECASPSPGPSLAEHCGVYEFSWCHLSFLLGCGLFSCLHLPLSPCGLGYASSPYPVGDRALPVALTS